MKYEGWKIGPRIQKLRKDQGLTAEDFSAELGVSVSHVSQIEQGGRKMSIDLMYRMMDVLQVDANTLLGVMQTGRTETSIDDEVDFLPKEQKAYFRTIFLQMIQKFPR